VAPACGQWETLLADALDGLLKPEDEGTFMAHRAACPACTALYEEARKGREWLEFLSPEPKAPEGFLQKILARTGPGHAAGVVGQAMPVPAGMAGVPAFVTPVRHPSGQDLPLGAPVRQQPGFLARLRSSVQPRLLMTAAMAFFSLALTLNLAGVRLTKIRLTGLQLSDLRPKAVRSFMERQLTMASVPIVRYYDHLRFVYEVKSSVQELRGDSKGEGNGEQGKETRPVTPGETRQNPGQSPGAGEGKSHENPPQQSGSPAVGPAGDQTNEFLESSLVLQGGSAQSGGSLFQRPGAVVGDPGFALQAWERSRTWIA
jgi:hypothetical protein